MYFVFFVLGKSALFSPASTGSEYVNAELPFGANEVHPGNPERFQCPLAVVKGKNVFTIFQLDYYCSVRFSENKNAVYTASVGKKVFHY